MLRDGIEDKFRPVLGRKQPGVATLLLFGGRHKPEEEDDDLAHHSTLKMLEIEASALQQYAAEQTVDLVKNESRCDVTLPPLRLPKPPNSRPKPVVIRHRGLLQPEVHQLPPVLSARYLQKDASDALDFLVATARNNAEYVHLLVAYYNSHAPAQGIALSHWLSIRPQNQYFWSGLHHRVRYRSPGRGRQLSLLEHAEEHIPPVRQPARLLTYVKGWMSEFDSQDSAQYRSRWLSVRSNRGNLARFFKVAANCALMARYLEKVLAQPERGNIIAEARKELLRVDAVIKGVQ